LQTQLQNNTQSMTNASRFDLSHAADVAGVYNDAHRMFDVDRAPGRVGVFAEHSFNRVTEAT
jgi:hypothetical protein